jgi:hypothetical protein
MCCGVGVCVCVCVCVTMCLCVPSICVGENLYLHFLNFSLCVCVQQGMYIAHKFESGWEVEVMKALSR